jgi:hypothetical protein
LSKLFSDIKTDIEEDISGAKTSVKKSELVDSLEELLKQPSKVITWYLYKTIHMGDEPEKKDFAQGIVDHLGGHGTVFGPSSKRSSSKRAQESVEDVVATHGPFNTNKGSKHGVLKTGRAKKLLADLTAFITTKIAEIRKSI